MEDRPEKKQKTSSSWREIWTGKRTGKKNNNNNNSSSSSSSRSSKDETKEKKVYKPAVMHVGWARWFDMTEVQERSIFLEMDTYLLAELGRVLQEERIPVPGTSVNDPKRFEWKTEIVHQHYPIVVKNLNDLKFPQRERVYSEDRHQWESQYPTRELAEFDLQWIKRKEDKKKKETAVLPKDGDAEEEGEAKAFVLPEAKDMVDIKTPLIDLWLVEDHWMSRTESTEALRSQADMRRALTKAISEGSKKVELHEPYGREPEWLLVDSPLHRAGRIVEVKNVWPPRFSSIHRNDPLYLFKRDKEYDVVTEQASMHGFKSMFVCLRAPDPPQRADLAWDGTDPEYQKMVSETYHGQEISNERKRRYDLYKPVNDAFARMLYNCHPELQAQRLLLLSGDMNVKNREHGATVTMHGLPKDLLRYTKTFIMGKTDGKDTKEEKPDEGGGGGRDDDDGNDRPSKKQKTSYRETVTVKRTGNKNNNSSSSSSGGDGGSKKKQKKGNPAVMHIGLMPWINDPSSKRTKEEFVAIERYLETELGRALEENKIPVPGKTEEDKERFVWSADDVHSHYPIQVVTLHDMKFPAGKTGAEDPWRMKKVYNTQAIADFDMNWIQRKEQKTYYNKENQTAETGIFQRKNRFIDLWVVEDYQESRLSPTETPEAAECNIRRELTKAIDAKAETFKMPFYCEDRLGWLLRDSPLHKAGRVFEIRDVHGPDKEIITSKLFDRRPIDRQDRENGHDAIHEQESEHGFKLAFKCTTNGLAGQKNDLRADVAWDTSSREYKESVPKESDRALQAARAKRKHDTYKPANDAFAKALFDYHPELQAERHSLLLVGRSIRDPRHRAAVNKPGLPLDVLKYTKSFIMGKTEVKDEPAQRKPAPMLGTEPIMHIGIVTFDDKIRDDLAIGLLNNTLLTSALDERRKVDKGVPAGLRTRCYSLTGLGLNSPEFRFGKYSWQAKELQDFDATWIQKTKKPTREDHPPEIHAWVYATSIGGPGNSISKHKGEETHKVLASVKPSEYISSPPIQGGGAEGNPFFAPAMVASMLLDSSFAAEGRVFRLETALARKLDIQADRLDPSRPIDLAHEIKETGVDREHTVVFIGQMSLQDNKFTGMNAGNKYTLIEKTQRGNLSTRLNNMKTASDKKNGNALLALQIHHAKVADAMVRLHPGLIEYEASKFLRDTDLMDPGSRSIFKQFFGKASDFARRKADSVGDLVTETASLPVKVLEQTPGQFVKTTAALPLSATRVVVSGKADYSSNLDGDDTKHTCGWDTEDENVRQHLGPGYWDIIHRTTANVHINERDLITARVFILWVAQNFPCESCRVKFSKSVSEPPIETVPKEKLFEHLVELHNQINRERGECEYPLERAKKRYKYTVE